MTVEASETEQDIEALFRHDPFAENESADDAEGSEAEAAAENAEGAGEAGSQQAEDGEQEHSEDEAAASEESAASPKPDESGEPAKGEDDAEALREQLRQQSAAIQELEQKLQKNSEQPQTQEKPEDENAVPDYNFQVPENIVNGLVSEDTGERQQAVAMLVSGIGQSVHATMQKQFREEMNAKLQEVQQNQQQSQHVSSKTEEIRQDYFGKYPNHDTELIRPLIRSKSQEIMSEWNVKQWTPKVRDEIARRVNAELQKAGFGGGPAQPEQPAPAAPGNGKDGPPHMRRNNSRPAGSGGGPNSASDIETTLFG